ncbi:MAG: hypothetical protein ABIS17_14950 [Casimicrobiaceae bacterium]
MSEPLHTVVAPGAVPDTPAYRVRSRLEIVSVIRGLQAHRELATVYFGGERDLS